MIMTPRKFIRHPTCIPIVAAPCSSDTPPTTAESLNVGEGGLAFHSSGKYAVGTLLHLTIPISQYPFETDARVTWSREANGKSETGVEFLSQTDAYQARMVEQICHIEAYRQHVRQHEGRELTSNEAAVEWVQQHAARFPKIV
jgi:hypothetical protein